MQEQMFRIDHHQFMDSFMLRCSGDRFSAFDLFGSRSMTPTNWFPIDHELIRVDGGFNFRLTKPIPISYLKLVSHGEIQDPQPSISYVTRLDDGQLAAFLKGKSIAFVGCARNCASDLRRSVSVLDALGANFASHSIHIFENDSTDDTPGVLASLATELPDVLGFTSVRGLDQVMPQRTARLAYGRNFLLDGVRRRGPRADYLCMVDMDGLLVDDFDREGFLSAFRVESAWDGVFPVFDGSYYDIWALRHHQVSPDDYTRALAGMDASLGTDLVKFFGAFARTAPLNRLDGWLRVDSAFGGVGIYKLDAIGGGRYIGLDGQMEVCEHVSLHQMMCAKGAHLYINPAMVVRSPPSGERDRIMKDLFGARG